MCVILNEPEFDIYTCDSGHMVIIEHKPDWKEQVKVEIACPVEREVAEYRTTVKFSQLPEALKKYMGERENQHTIVKVDAMVKRSNNCRQGTCTGQIDLKICLKKQREKTCEVL